MPSPLSRTPLTSRSIETDIGVPVSLKAPSTISIPDLFIFFADQRCSSDLAKSHHPGPNTTIRDGWDSIAPIMARPPIRFPAVSVVQSPPRELSGASSHETPPSFHIRSGLSLPPPVLVALDVPVLPPPHRPSSTYIMTRFVGLHSQRDEATPSIPAPSDWASFWLDLRLLLARRRFLCLSSPCLPHPCQTASSLRRIVPELTSYFLEGSGGAPLCADAEAGLPSRIVLTIVMVCAAAAGVDECDEPVCRSACAGPPFLPALSPSIDVLSALLTFFRRAVDVATRAAVQSVATKDSRLVSPPADKCASPSSGFVCVRTPRYSFSRAAVVDMSFGKSTDISSAAITLEPISSGLPRHTSLPPVYSVVSRRVFRQVLTPTPHDLFTRYFFKQYPSQLGECMRLRISRFILYLVVVDAVIYTLLDNVSA
ncbi:hypothetical protein R3P38DRAFT_3237325 [Favolaschia claudopus]|uniref:Uncharacterized protein n=1 Tax=Favolaschia claudopus TaxID=2862362 RepID=A0AAV9ZB49_9AGAR